MDFSTEPVANLYSGGTFAHWVTTSSFIPIYVDSQGFGLILVQPGTFGAPPYGPAMAGNATPYSAEDLALTPHPLLHGGFNKRFQNVPLPAVILWRAVTKKTPGMNDGSLPRGFYDTTLLSQVWARL